MSLEIDPSYWEPPDDPDAEDRFFEAIVDRVREVAQQKTLDLKDDQNEN